LQGFVDKMFTPASTDIKMSNNNNIDLLKFSMTPSNMEVITNLAQSQYLDNVTQSEGFSILKNERLNTPGLVQPQNVKQMLMSPPPPTSG
jgi:hypothetical protein